VCQNGVYAWYVSGATCMKYIKIYAREKREAREGERRRERQKESVGLSLSLFSETRSLSLSVREREMSATQNTDGVQE